MARLIVWTADESRCICGFGFIWDQRSEGLRSLSQLKQEQHETVCSAGNKGRGWAGIPQIKVYGAVAAENPPWS